METIAIYWEPVIKTYGFQEAADLCLCEIALSNRDLADWGLFLARAELAAGFRLLLLEPTAGHLLRFSCLFDRRDAPEMQHLLGESLAPAQRQSLRMTCPVDMLFFHGPHFGDRYGIARAAFDALAAEKLPLLVAACAGSAVYLVLPPERLGDARRLLGRVFVDPAAGGSSD